MKKIFLALSIMLYGVTAFAQNTDNLLKSYLSVKNALVESDPKAAETAIAGFYETVKNEGQLSENKDWLKAVEKLSKTGGSLDKQRASLNDVSTAVWKLVKNSGNLSQSVYYQYCPMKKTYWLSSDKEIKNPYYGASMLTCGKIVETKS